MLLAVLIVLFPTMARADTVQLYAAGSLRGALTDVAKAFEAKSGNKVAAKFGPSGALKNEIAGGANAQVFASANMEHPQALHDAGKSGPVVRFARNRMCALANPLLKVATSHSRLMVSVVNSAADMERLQPLLKRKWGADRIGVGPRVAYLWCPDSILDSELANAVAKALGDGVTSRNWGTITKLHALVKAIHP